MTPTPLEQAVVYVVGLALGWALIPEPPQGRPMIPRTVAAIKYLALATIFAILPKKGEALVVKAIGQFDKILTQLDKAIVQIADQQAANYDAIDEAYDHYRRTQDNLGRQNEQLDVSFDRALKVRNNVAALVGK